MSCAEVNSGASPLMKNDESIDCSNEGTVAMLYQRLGRPALSKTLYLVGQANVAEEIVQESFVRLWQKKPVFPTLRQAYAWIYRSCTNAAIDYLRNKSNQSVEFEIDSLASTVGLDLEQRTALKQTWQAVLRSLDEDEAELFIYRAVEGLNQDEVAEVMAISRRTVNRMQDKVAKKIGKIKERGHGG